MRSSQVAAVAVVIAVAVTSGCAPTAPYAVQWEPSGSVDTHDPALIIDDGGTTDTIDDVWYVYSTGNGAVGLGSPQVRQSTDQGKTWDEVGPAWRAEDEPYWARELISGVDNFWAPEVVAHDGVYYMYYSASTFGSNTSLIGLYTNTTLDPDDPEYRWEDQGEVVRSTGSSPFNAIDPGVITDAHGEPWMVFGSFWEGLFMVPLEWPSGKLPGQAGVTDDPLGSSGVEPVQVADRGYAPNAIEAGFLYEREGWYYLFFSRDSCCQGTDSTYNMAVGRSRDITGPYVDDAGVALTEDGGRPLLGTVGTMIGPGGQSVARVGNKDVLAFHYYDKDLGGMFQLGLRELAWTDDGWPIVTTPQDEELLPEG
ncbi:arabinan endo-1,5-alpha-L-arabinosidase [Jonesia denitrificans]|uniref:Arabinan endo-1,5-alpha-L-arabinosidase n=1 Tax=Jonesia denitrificans (strain ATCC 14870 / DSM 20603 / BCRC 15368 / CIP 55.134 / JCM 11481 / NBRC 15587 / NCTC 10816 / Prevot 55134) TaxID=471856 RepID=C7R0C1_JONDD|nr:arabinan endo-1,5-alpha-L-arabinosidase [Jonesia denitrificans]ACV08180.1 Arabinan endo-1,5-alpha-L-arabinosidase [Jonesia denitrificans DSM 20603]AVJ53300.1 arabinan endo-1,5-alpha-L-arabinosidase [Jonesia denitrificans]QXB42749.1 arabinan endo-1,5-alpha-L-arabinosidase [Jonesia denitrificans]SQH20161.1 Arabinan endo-1,5-alpha-L-arabinosidase precursor [Jonesia denitrificans]